MEKINKINQKNRYLFLLILTIATGIGFQGWRTLLNNFAVNKAGILGDQMGVIQSVREIPGFLSLLVVFILLIVKEEILAALALMLMGIGISLVGFLPSYYGLIFTTLLMSTGFHYYETVNQSLTLQYFTKKETPIILSKFKSIGAFVNILVGLSIFILMKYLSYKIMFMVLGVLVISIVFLALKFLPNKDNLAIQRKNMVFRKKYWLFYTLTFLAGARRQIFVVFSVFLMVKRFHFTIYEITILFVLNNISKMIFMPLIGKAINRFQEKKVLSLEYALIIPIFLVYAYSENRYMIMAVYILDHIVFNFSLAIKTFFQKIADESDIAPSMAVSFTINHIAAVVIPALGGALWILDYKIPFIFGIAIAVISLTFVQFIPVKDFD